MEFLSLTLNGAQKALSKELSSFGIKSLIGDFHAKFDAGKKELLQFAYFSQGSKRICKILSIETLPKDILNNQNSDTEIKIASLNVPKELLDNDEFFSLEVYSENEQLRKTIIKALEQTLRIKYNSNNKIIVIIDENKNEIIYAKDIFSFDFSKRDYKVFINPRTIHPITAFTLISHLNPSPEKTYFDPFCSDGTIAIELSYFLKKSSHNFFRKEIFNNSFFDFETENYLNSLDKKNLKHSKNKINIIASDTSPSNLISTKKNAKIAMLHKDIRFTRKELKWIDLTMQNNSIDSIISFPQKYNNSLKDFYKYLDAILKKNAKIFYATDKLDHPLTEYGFITKPITKISQGHLIIELYKINKN
ncbi:MAG TPA: hypothetical protein PLX15_02985 [Candidatus Woesearchaeota archaeon]|jgi:23S rRNA G2445 N2-methylase RlmL|nr:hypothetical protein [Candidatus Woesearchaeota archaeon]